MISFTIALLALVTGYLIYGCLDPMTVLRQPWQKPTALISLYCPDGKSS